MIETSATLVPATAPRSGHPQAGDFARWGRLGGSRMLALYGRGWFALLARVRWEKVTAEQLAKLFASLSRKRS